MSEEPLGGSAPEDDAEQTPRGGVELGDEREHWRFWMPRYIVGLYSEQLGQRGLALYASLAWWLCSDAPHHRPTLKEIGRRAGCSRSTVWRGLKELATVGVIRIDPVCASTGRRAHKITLIHPSAAKEYERQFGTPLAGGSNLTPPRAQLERAEVSNCARGALNLSAPSGSNRDPIVCVNAAPKAPDTHTSAARPPLGEETGKFVEKWMDALIGGSRVFRKEQEAEARELGARLLAAGWHLTELLRDIADPARPPNEYPRVYAERHGPEALWVARNAAQVVQERQERARNTQQALQAAARQAALRAQFAALSTASRAEWTAAAEQTLLPKHHRPAIVAARAFELFAIAQAEDGTSAPPIPDNGSSSQPPAAS